MRGQTETQSPETECSIEMLVAETLTEKNRRLRQMKCSHEEVFRSTCTGPAGTFTTAVCLDCGKTWNGVSQ